jgi:hypothetical protein
MRQGDSVMTALKGLLEALVLIVIGAAVAAAAALAWLMVGSGGFVERLGVTLVAVGVLWTVTSSFAMSRLGSAHVRAFLGAGPETDNAANQAAGDGWVLTGLGVTLFVTVPLIGVGAALMT